MSSPKNRTTSLQFTRPLLRHHSGKWRLAPWILDFFPQHECYVEPFGGGAGLLLQKPRCELEVYNDADRDLVNLFEIMRDHGEGLARAVEFTPFSRRELQLASKPTKDKLERARRTLVRASMKFQDTAGAEDPLLVKPGSARATATLVRDWVGLPEIMRAMIERLRGVMVENFEVRALMRNHDSLTTLHYVDPPSPRFSRKVNSHEKANRYQMTIDQHHALASTLHELKGLVVLSGYDNDLYSKTLYRDWRCVQRAALVDGTKERTELLWVNPACAKALDGEKAQLDLLEFCQ